MLDVVGIKPHWFRWLGQVKRTDIEYLWKKDAETWMEAKMRLIYKVKIRG